MRTSHRTDPGSKLDTFAYATALSTVTLSPWLLGASDPWAYGLTSIMSHVALIVWLAARIHRPRPWREPGLLIGSAFYCAFLWLYTAYLPTEWVQTLSPANAEFQITQRDIITSTGLDRIVPVNDNAGLTLSYAPTSTRNSLILITSFMSIFVVLLHSHHRFKRIRTTLLVLTTSATLLAILGILQNLSGTRDVFWVISPRFGGSIFGTFSNRNHYAAWTNMMIALSCGLLLRHKIIAYTERAISDKRGVEYIGLLAIALMSASVVLSTSRAGIISLCLILAAWCIFGRGRVRPADTKPLILAGSLFLLALLTWWGWTPVLDRFDSLIQTLHDPAADTRTQATIQTLKIFTDNPILGTGPGTFQYVFPIYQTESLQIGRFLHAHNDWAQLLAEYGVIGISVATGCLILILARVYSAWQHMKSRDAVLVLGTTIALISICFHSALDYSLHKPAVAYLLTALIAVVLSSTALTRERQAQPSPQFYPAIRHVVPLLLIGILILMITREARSATTDLATVRFNNYWRYSQSGGQRAEFEHQAKLALKEADIIIRQKPVLADSQIDLAARCLAWAATPEFSDTTRAAMAYQALRASAQATGSAPSDYSTWLLLSHAQAALGVEPDALLSYQQATRLVPAGRTLTQPSQLRKLTQQRSQ